MLDFQRHGGYGKGKEGIRGDSRSVAWIQKLHIFSFLFSCPGVQMEARNFVLSVNEKGLAYGSAFW